MRISNFKLWIVGIELPNFALDSEVEDKGIFEVTDMLRPTAIFNDDGRSAVPLTNPYSPSTGSDSTVLSQGSMNTDVLSLSALQGHHSPKLNSEQ